MASRIIPILMALPRYTPMIRLQ